MGARECVAPLPHLLFILPCRCLFVDFLLRSGSSHHLPPFLLLSSLPPLPLLPPCSLIPPFPRLFQCHLVSYVRILGGEWIWCSAVIRVTRRCSPVCSCVVVWAEFFLCQPAGLSQRDNWWLLLGIPVPLYSGKLSWNKSVRALRIVFTDHIWKKTHVCELWQLFEYSLLALIVKCSVSSSDDGDDVELLRFALKCTEQFVWSGWMRISLMYEVRLTETEMLAWNHKLLAVHYSSSSAF